MNQEEKLFIQLKKEIAATFLQDFPSLNPDISQWKGLDIIYFQEHLRQKVRGNVSEKWFYTHFKSSYEKLPRIDMLNLLAQYCGYRRGWAEFCETYQKNERTESIVETEEKFQPIKNNSEDIISVPKEITKQKNAESFFKNNFKKYKKLILTSCISVIVLFSGISGFIYIENRNTYKFCFYDSDRGSLISSELRITIKKNGISPEYYNIKDGCFNYKSSIDTLKIEVESPIYKKENFIIDLKSIREHKENNQRNFILRPNDYAVMLYYYSTSFNNADEKQKALFINKRKEELNKLIADNALIYQVYDSEIFGVEVLDKKMYIDFMTTPTTSLKNYVLIESKTNKNNRISLIKFKIQKNEN